jgi:hypothetical protein
MAISDNVGRVGHCIAGEMNTQEMVVAGDSGCDVPFYSGDSRGSDARRLLFSVWRILRNRSPSH